MNTSPRNCPEEDVDLVGAELLDREMAGRGLEPVEATATVTVPLDPGQRVTVNATYRNKLAS